MPQTELSMRKLFTDLVAGDQVEVTHEVKVGMKTWMTTTVGTVVKSERRRHGLHFQRNADDKAWSDCLVLRRDDGELTTVTIDEYTKLKKL